MANEAIALWTDTSSDPELIAGVRAGDGAAFGVLYERHVDAARKVAAQYTNTAADVDDVVSESFSRVLRALQRGDGPDLAFRAYLFTIVRRAGMDTVNRGNRTRPGEDMSHYEAALGYEAPSDEGALAGFEQGVVADAFNSLPERWQAVLWYTEVEKKSPREIAPLLGLTANGVAALAYRAREALRQAYLQQHLNTAESLDCLAAAAQLGAYVRGGLAKREHVKVDDHVRTCEKCAALVAELEDVNRGMRGIIAPLVLGMAGLGALEGGLPIGGVFGAGEAAGASGAAGATAASGSSMSGVGAAATGASAWVSAASAIALPAAAALGFVALVVSGATYLGIIDPLGRGLEAASTPSPTAEPSPDSDADSNSTDAASLDPIGPDATASPAPTPSAEPTPTVEQSPSVDGVVPGDVGNPTQGDPDSDADPSGDPTGDPTTDPSTDPTGDPTTDPSIDPTDPAPDPSIDPTGDPTTDPTTDPSTDPTGDPTTDPSTDPTGDPTTDPTTDPSPDPTTDPSPDPTVDPNPPVKQPALSFKQAPFEQIEISQTTPQIGMSLANSGEGAAEDLTATILLPDGLTFALPAAGAPALGAVPAVRLADYMGFYANSSFAAGEWECAFDASRSVATCTLDGLDAASDSDLSLDLAPITDATYVAPGARTVFTAEAGEVGATYSVRTSIKRANDEAHVSYAASGKVAAKQVGATLMGCDTGTTACRVVMGSTLTDAKNELNNNHQKMRPLNEAGGKINSATTNLSSYFLPHGARVKYALLEWSASRATGDDWLGEPRAAKLRVPGGDYATITADTVAETNRGNGAYYQARADITELVASAGRGEYSLADIALAAETKGKNFSYFGGFTITVVYEHQLLPESRVALFTGSQWVAHGADADFSFHLPERSAVSLGWTAWAGERGTHGDMAFLDGDNFTPIKWPGSLLTPGNPGNAADSTAFGGNWANTLGVDAKAFYSKLAVAPGQHSIKVSTNTDEFLIGSVALTVTPTR